MKHFLMYSIIILVLMTSWGRFIVTEEPTPGINPIYAFKNSMNHRIADIEQEAQILVELGYDGYAHEGFDGLKYTLEVLDEHNLRLFNSYLDVTIDSGEQPFEQGLKKALPLLKDRGFTLWCSVHSSKYSPSDTEGDKYAVPIFQRLSDLVAPYNVQIAPYPHINAWVESPMDTVRLAKKVNRPNFGTSFNLYHWNELQQDKPPLEEMIKQLVANDCYAISLNGSNRIDDDINIGPMVEDEIGQYTNILNLFRDAGYTGPVGLQCYGINAAPRVYLKQSMVVWQQVKKQVIDFETKDKAEPKP